MGWFLFFVGIIVIIILFRAGSAKRTEEAIRVNKKNYNECFDFEKYPIIEKEFVIKARGVTQINEDTKTDRQLHIKSSKIGDHFMLIPEPENKFDSHAVRIKAFDGFSIGYFPAGSNVEIFELLNKGCFVDAELIEKPYFEDTYGAVLKISVYGEK